MATDQIRYDILTQEALRGVLRGVLADVARKGLPGDHHFKITFRTKADGVQLSQRMRARYPEEMTVVLQHQFWDLTVGEEAFEVGLSFGGVTERIRVPFESITAFFDPAVQFGLQFATAETTADEAEAETDKAPSASTPTAVKPAEPGSIDTDPDTLPPQPSGGGATSGASGGAEVVRLDRFRKK